MKRSYLIFVSLALILLMGCSGEGYIGVINNTDGFVVFSLNDQPDETILAGDTSNIYTVSVSKGVVNNIPITATGEYLIDYHSSVSITDGNYVWHKIGNQAYYSYVQVENGTDSSIILTVANNSSEVLNKDEKSQIYSVLTLIGEQGTIEISADGYWVDNSQDYSLSIGDTTTITIENNLAELNIINTSVDSSVFNIERYEPLYFVGEESINDMYLVDGNVDVSYYGRYIFLTEENKSWTPGNNYSYEMIPDACEIQLNNLHPTWTIYYVYISRSTEQTWGDDKLGDDVLESGYGYVWKADGDVQWDMRVEAGDPHPDSALYVFDYYDVDTCESDFTWIYEFPTIFSPADLGKMAKSTGPNNGMMKPASLSKTWDNTLMPARIEKIKKVDAGKAGVKALRK